MTTAVMKKFLPILLALALLCGLLPVAALAQAPEAAVQGAQAPDEDTPPADPEESAGPETESAPAASAEDAAAAPEETAETAPEARPETDAASPLAAGPAPEPAPAEVTVTHALPATVTLGQTPADTADCTVHFHGLVPGEQYWLSLGEDWQSELFAPASESGAAAGPDVAPEPDETDPPNAAVFTADAAGTAPYDRLALLGAARAPGSLTLQPQYCPYEEGAVPQPEDFIPVGPPLVLTVAPPEADAAETPDTQPPDAGGSTGDSDTQLAGPDETAPPASRPARDVLATPQEDPADPAPALTRLAITPGETTLRVNGSFAPVLVPTPANASTEHVSLTSSNTAVAAVSPGAFAVRGLAPGTATITATDADTRITATCKVTVKPAVAAVTLNTAAQTLRKGGSCSLVAAVEPSNAFDTAVTWESLAPAVATVSATGAVTAKAAGTATIQCTSVDNPNRYARCTVTVKPPAKKVTLDKKAAEVRKGKTITLRPTVAPADAFDTAVTWKSSKKSVASVSPTGVVKGKKAGTATITCTSVDSPKKTAKCKITVKPAAKKVTMSQTEATVDVGRTLNLSAAVKPANAYGAKIVWGSSNSKVASVTSKGLVKAKQPGTVTITAKHKNTGKKATCKLTVQKRNFQAELDKILAKYPNGSYFTNDGGLPSEYGGSSQLLGRCGAFVDYVAGELYQSYDGFSKDSGNYFGYYYYRQEQIGAPARGRDEIIALLNGAKPGDILFAHPLAPGKIEHFAIYLGHDANFLYLYECNWDNRGGVRYRAAQTYNWYTDSREVILYRVKDRDKLYD